ncbi:hypothetical protein [Variovorax boronicumulans]|uniref:hypothetical protein n=1 Tax=Variovorax boronicumulans TaxID=436515 RepID=UPI003396FA17
MPAPRNIALTVHELEQGEFYWVLMEAAAADGDALHHGAPDDQRHVYEPLEAAHEPYATYSNALVAGVAAMRRLCGADGKATDEARCAALPAGRSL